MGKNKPGSILNEDLAGKMISEGFKAVEKKLRKTLIYLGYCAVQKET